MNSQINLISRQLSSLTITKLILCFIMFSGMSHATTPDYVAWKASQQQQDAKLQQKTTASTANHYLSKPSLMVSSVDKISLNNASVEQLQQLSGIGQKKAEAIVQYRQKHGAFKTIDEIQLVKGIGPAIFNKNRARLSL